jgi:hypothetical protein
VIPAVGDEAFPDGGWLSPLNKAIYPSRADWRKSQPAKGCPQFGPASVIERPMDYDREGEFSVRPGLIRPERGEHSVVWWDPSKLTLNVDGGIGFHQKEILSDDGGASLAGYHEWRAARSRVIEEGARPQYQVFIASQAPDAPPGELVRVEVATVAKSARMAAGRRFGTLVHNVMRDVPLNADRGAARQLIDWNTRLVGATDDERDAAAEAVESALAHPLLARARAAARCYREYPLVAKLADGRLLEGIIDLAFVENDEWAIVDFKTDADAAERRAQYERQLQWYRFALTQLTKMPARAYLLEI